MVFFEMVTVNEFISYLYCINRYLVSSWRNHEFLKMFVENHQTGGSCSVHNDIHGLRADNSGQHTEHVIQESKWSMCTYIYYNNWNYTQRIQNYATCTIETNTCIFIMVHIITWWNTGTCVSWNICSFFLYTHTYKLSASLFR